MRRIWVVPLSAVLASASSGALAAPAPSTPPPDWRFKAETLADGLVQPMELELAPDGRIFINELGGRLKIYEPHTRELVEAGRLEVFAEQENGFLGFALDPDFPRNGWIYLLYSPKDFSGARLSRFTLRGNMLDLASESRLLEFEEQRRECCHHAGSVEFGPDGNLYVSTGDNTHPGGDSAGYAPLDERPDRSPYDAQKSSANTHDLRGKILRLRPQPEGGYTVPVGNLFPRDGSQGRPEIFVMGCRNPWRMSIDVRTGIVYWGDVGPDAGGDSTRGPRGYDEINQARRAGNFGWPYFVGRNSAYADWDFAANRAGPRFDALRPTNHSPNNTGAKVLPPAQPAFLYWPYGKSKEFPALGEGGRTACAGPVFHFQSGHRRSGGFPKHFDRCLLFFDWQRPFMHWARLDARSRLVGLEPFTAAVTVANDRDRVAAARARGEFVIQRPVDAQFGVDGCLYLLDYGATWGTNPDARLVRISHQWDNLPPLARAAADQSSGREPLTVALTSAGSKDLEGGPVRFQWRVHPDGRLLGEASNAVLTLEQPGNYVIELRVTDAQGATAVANAPIIAGNSVPEVRFLEPREDDFFTPGQPVRYALLVRDAEDGSSADHEENFHARAYVRATWGRGDGPGAEDEPGLALMKRSDCFDCHAVAQKIVAPPFVEIAARYRGQPGALDPAVQRVLKGSSGVWGEVPMLPHPALTDDQARQMVQWIFARQAEQENANLARGLDGAIPAPGQTQARVATLEATYTDRGRAAAGALTGRATVRLRHRRVEAEHAEEKQGLKALGSFLGAIDHGHYARLAGLNLSDSASATFRVASGGRGGVIELRAGTVNGPVLAHVSVQPTGGWEKWVELTAPLSPSAERGDVFVVFVNPGQGGLMNLDWVQFNPR